MTGNRFRLWAQGLATVGIIGLAVGASSPAAAAYPAPPGLIAGEDATISVERGGKGTEPISVGNSTTTAIPAAYLLLEWPHGIKPLKTFENCYYASDLAICEFDTEVAPGKQYALQPQLQYDIPADIFAPRRMYTTSYWYTADGMEKRLPKWRETYTSRGTGGKVALEATSEPVATWSGYGAVEGAITYIEVTGNNPVNLKAVGATVRGAVGDTVKVKISEQNTGPAVADFDGSISSLKRSTLVTLPEGTSVVTAPENCRPHQGRRDPGVSGSRYICDLDKSLDYLLKVNASQDWEFSLRIDREGETKGSLRTNYYWFLMQSAGGIQAEETGFGTDTNAADDTAEIIVNPAKNADNPGTGPTPGVGTSTGPGTGGTGPGTGGTDNGTGTDTGAGTGGTGTGGTGTGGTGTGTGIDEAAADDQADTGSGGALAVTGANVATFAGVGVLLVVAGAVALLVTRRRRVTRSDA